MSLELWIPPKARPKWRCRVAVSIDPETGRPAPCGKPFFEHERQAFERHVKACADEHLDVLRELGDRAYPKEFMEPDWADLEFEAWVRQHGRVK